MIANLTKPTDFHQPIAYILQDRKSSELIAGNCISNNPAAMAREFNLDWQKNERVKSPVRHISIAMAPQDGEVDKKLQAVIAKEFLIKMGFLLPAHEQADRDGRKGDCLYIVATHGRVDPDHKASHEQDHFHILTTTVNCYGKKIPDSWEYYRSMDALSAIEKEFGLYQTPRQSDAIHLSHGQKQRMNAELREVAEGLRENVELPVSMKLRSIIIGATQDQPPFPEFLARLKEREVSARTRSLTNGKLGISYELEGIAFPGSKIRCSIAQLVAQGRVIDYPNESAINNKDFVSIPRSSISEAAPPQDWGVSRSR